jgi:hypothetical protein
MPALPAFDGTSAFVRVVPFNPLADPAAMARKRNAMLAQLAQERVKPRPDEWLVKAYETWLRAYNRNTEVRRG